MEHETLNTILKSGLLGAIAAWALWQNARLVGKIISVAEATVAVLTELKNAINELRTDIKAAK